MRAITLFALICGSLALPQNYGNDYNSNYQDNYQQGSQGRQLDQNVNPQTRFGSNQQGFGIGNSIQGGLDFNRQNNQQGGRDFNSQNNQQAREIIPIIRDNRHGPINGHYTFDFETGNGIVRSEEGNPTAPNGAVVVTGEWSHPFPPPPGGNAHFSFIANEFGYQPQSDLLPTAPPMPAHALEAIARGERERAAGIIHGGEYNPSTHGGGFYDPTVHGGGQYVPGQY